VQACWQQARSGPRMTTPCHYVQPAPPQYAAGLPAQSLGGAGPGAVRPLDETAGYTWTSSSVAAKRAVHQRPRHGCKRMPPLPGGTYRRPGGQAYAAP
jgi:hypothetical protein